MERSRVVIRNNIGWALCVTLFLQGDPTGGLLSRRSREFIFQRQRSDCNRLISDYIRRGRKTGRGEVFVIRFPAYVSIGQGTTWDRYYTARSCRQPPCAIILTYGIKSQIKINVTAFLQ